MMTGHRHTGDVIHAEAHGQNSQDGYSEVKVATQNSTRVRFEVVLLVETGNYSASSRILCM